jgi:hypothetical protein
MRAAKFHGRSMLHAITATEAQGMKLSTSAAAQIAQDIQSMGRLRYMFIIPCYGWPLTDRLID